MSLVRTAPDRIATWSTRQRWLPSALTGGVLALDAISARIPFSWVGTGLLDEPAHTATSAILLLGLAPDWVRGNPGLAAVAVASSNLIDVDHLPQAWGKHWFDGVPGGRPFTHSLLTSAVPLALVAGSVGRRAPHTARVLSAISGGLCLHFVRDLFNGPGLALLWPARTGLVRLPSSWYPLGLGAVAGYRLLRR